MAQVLKPEQKEKIISAAKDELLKNGYRDASMRRIAMHASMTVGNLYRYFENKDQLIQFVVQPAVDELNTIIQKSTEDRFSLYAKTERIGYSQKELFSIIYNMSDELAGLHQRHKEELAILMLHSDATNKIREWFSELIYTLVNELYQIDTNDLTMFLMFSKMMSASICEGIKECLRLIDKMEISDSETERIFRLYFTTFISMIKLPIDLGGQV